MATAADVDLSHIDVPLPEAPSASFFTETQWKTWYALMDTVVPSVVPSSGEEEKHGELSVSSALLDSYYDAAQTKMSKPPSRSEFEAFLSEKPSSSDAFRAQMVRTLTGVPKGMREQLGSVLNLLR